MDAVGPRARYTVPFSALGAGDWFARASASGLSAVRALADEVVCLHAPERFDAVGCFCRSFAQVGDAEAAACLAAPAQVGR